VRTEIQSLRRIVIQLREARMKFLEFAVTETIAHDLLGRSLADELIVLDFLQG
jgi:hypothetical protein